MTQDEYAFGCNEYEGTVCPAKAAGLRPEQGGVTAYVAEEYDNTSIAYQECDEGTLPEKIARKRWKEARDIFQQRLNRLRESDTASEEEIEWSEKKLEVSEKVIEELGWDDE